MIQCIDCNLIADELRDGRCRECWSKRHEDPRFEQIFNAIQALRTEIGRELVKLKYQIELVRSDAQHARSMAELTKVVGS